MSARCHTGGFSATLSPPCRACRPNARGAAVIASSISPLAAYTAVRRGGRQRPAIDRYGQHWTVIATLLRGKRPLHPFVPYQYVLGLRQCATPQRPVALHADGDG
jgi:hypothetical protein